MSILSKKSLLKTAIVMLLLICVSSTSFSYKNSESNGKDKDKKAEHFFYTSVNLGVVKSALLNTEKG
uniref:Uncharacterized protein n=2 Tax=unclassified Wolbachia TaxID=2640676 RepID=A0A3B0IWF9_9RICK